MASARARSVVITGASSGVGRACARSFARRGARLTLVARNEGALEMAAAEAREVGAVAPVVVADVADAAAVEKAAAQAEARSCKSGRRSPTARPPFQSAYCATKAAIRGFTDSLRSELIHDRSRVRLCMVQLPAVNTPQFVVARNRMPRRPKPVPPIYDPSFIAEAIVHASEHPRREYVVTMSALKAIAGQKLVPGMLDRYLARVGYDAQQTPGARAGGPSGQSVGAGAGRPGSRGAVRPRVQAAEPALVDDAADSAVTLLTWRDIDLAGVVLAGLVAGYVMSLTGLWAGRIPGLTAVDIADFGRRYMVSDRPSAWLFGLFSHLANSVILVLAWAMLIEPNLSWPRWLEALLWGMSSRSPWPGRSSLR